MIYQNDKENHKQRYKSCTKEEARGAYQCDNFYQNDKVDLKRLC